MLSKVQTDIRKKISIALQVTEMVAQEIDDLARCISAATDEDLQLVTARRIDVKVEGLFAIWKELRTHHSDSIKAICSTIDINELQANIVIIASFFREGVDAQAFQQASKDAQLIGKIVRQWINQLNEVT